MGVGSPCGLVGVFAIGDGPGDDVHASGSHGVYETLATFVEFARLQGAIDHDELLTLPCT